MHRVAFYIYLHLLFLYFFDNSICLSLIFKELTMSFVPMTEMLADAKRHHYAVAQFNINGLLWIQATLLAAEKLKSPVILAASDRMITYLGGFDTVYQMARAIQKQYSITIPVSLHLDHSPTPERCFQAIDAGFSSVMFDGSHSPIDENIQKTKIVCQYAKKHNVSVEAEVGTVGGNEDGLVGGVSYANLDECVRLADETKADALAAALGSVHGHYNSEGPRLGFEEMKRLSEILTIPLVLHGASGIPEDQLQKCIELGHAKINYNTELVTTWAKSVRATLAQDGEVSEPRLIMTPAKEAIEECASSIMIAIGSNNRI